MDNLLLKLLAAKMASGSSSNSKSIKMERRAASRQLLPTRDDIAVAFTLDDELHTVTVTAADTADTYRESIERFGVQLSAKAYMRVIAMRDHQLLVRRYPQLADLSDVKFEPEGNSLYIGDGDYKVDAMLSKPYMVDTLLDALPTIHEKMQAFAATLPGLKFYVVFKRGVVVYLPWYNNRVYGENFCLGDDRGSTPDTEVRDEALARYRTRLTAKKSWLLYQAKMLADQLEALRVAHNLPAMEPWQVPAALMPK